MKLKVIVSAEVETTYELPVFLYYQDELDLPTFVKIEENNGKMIMTTVSVEHGKLTVSREYDAVIHSFNNKDLTKEEYFNDALEDALNDLSPKL